MHHKTKGLTNLGQRRVLHYDTELLSVEHHHLHEFYTEFLTEEQPESLGKALAEDEHLVGIIEIKKIVVEDDNLCGALLQSFYQSGFVFYITRTILPHFVKQIHESHACNALRVCQYHFHCYSLRYFISYATLTFLCKFSNNN